MSDTYDEQASYDTEINDLSLGAGLKDGNDSYDHGSDETKEETLNKPSLLTKILAGSVTVGGTAIVVVTAAVVTTQVVLNYPKVTAPVITAADTTIQYDVPLTYTSNGSLRISLDGGNEHRLTAYEPLIFSGDTKIPLTYELKGSFSDLVPDATYSFKVLSDVGYGDHTIYQKTIPLSQDHLAVTDFTSSVDYSKEELIYHYAFSVTEKAVLDQVTTKIVSPYDQKELAVLYDPDLADNAFPLTGFTKGYYLRLYTYDGRYSSAVPIYQTVLYY
jgi:hypothetical protein